MNMRARIGLALATGVLAGTLSAQEVTLPNRKTSEKFLVLGDAGTGDKQQYAVASMIIKVYGTFKFPFAIMLGDNLYGGERPQDFAKKFELPYKALLEDKVEFNAALGNHDDPNQRYYKPFNMGGERFRTYKKGNVRFFILDSNYLDPDQVKWLQKELAASASEWKIAYFHHPLYTTAARGPELELRKILEPIFIKGGVDVVFSGHEHIYERIRPQSGIHYFTAGGAAKLRSGDTRPGDITEVGFASDRSFMIVEVAGDTMFFQAISGAGKTVDKGVIARKLGADPKNVATSTPTAAVVPVKNEPASAESTAAKPAAPKPAARTPVVKKPVVKKTSTVKPATPAKPAPPPPPKPPEQTQGGRTGGTPLACIQSKSSTDGRKLG